MSRRILIQHGKTASRVPSLPTTNQPRSLTTSLRRPRIEKKPTTAVPLEGRSAVRSSKRTSRPLVKETLMGDIVAVAEVAATAVDGNTAAPTEVATTIVEDTTIAVI